MEKVAAKPISSCEAKGILHPGQVRSRTKHRNAIDVMACLSIQEVHDVWGDRSQELVVIWFAGWHHSYPKEKYKLVIDGFNRYPVHRRR
jgi:hypothetical protein